MPRMANPDRDHEPRRRRGPSRRAGRLTAVALAAGAAVACSPESAPEPAARNVILFIGDGFGMNQFSLGVSYADEIAGRPLRMSELADAGEAGYALPFAYDRVLTDSAASATQMATGQRALTETLSVSPETGEPVPTILEWAEERGLATGLVSNMRLTHATPAAFKVHARSRYVPEPELADQLFTEPEVEVLLGGGGRAMVPAEQAVSASVPGLPEGTDGDSNRSDDRNLIADAESRGYTVVGDRDSLAMARGAERLLGIFAASHLPYVLDRSFEGLDDSVPSLAEMTDAAIASLSGDEDGFFLMVEGGLIDYAGHENDAGAMLAEILDFDAAVGAAFDFAAARDDTLVLVTADHGTGGFTFTYGPDGPGPVPDTVAWDYRAGSEMAHREHLELLTRQRRSLLGAMREVSSPATAASVLEVIEEATGIRLTDAEAEALAADLDRDPPTPPGNSRYYLDRFAWPTVMAAQTLANHTHAVWSTGGHTSEPVILLGYGPRAAGVRGIGLNTRVYEIIRTALSDE